MRWITSNLNSTRNLISNLECNMIKINRLFFENKDYVLEGEVDFSHLDFDAYHVRKINKVSYKVTGQIYDDLLILKVKYDADVISSCAYTLEDLPYKAKGREIVEISNEIQDDEFIFYEENNIFDFEPYLISIIVSNVPTKLVKKGAKLPSAGEGYRVLSEEEYEKEQKENKKPSPFDELDNLDLD